MGFGGGGNSGQVKGSGGVIVPADGNDCAGGEGRSGQHVVVRGGGERVALYGRMLTRVLSKMRFEHSSFMR